MAPGRVRDELKERQWRRWMAQWRTSGLSVSAFCARHGLSPANFYAWRRTLERRAAAPAAFVPVHVVADTAHVVADTAQTPVSALELVLAEGRSVRVAPGFDAVTLRQLLAVLREERPC
jgi:transposase-like protein